MRLGRPTSFAGLVVARQGPLRDEVVSDRAAADQVFLDDPLQHGRIALSIPRPFRVDDGDGAGLADAKAVGLGAQHAAIGEPQLDETPLQVVPRHNRPIPIAAFRLGLVAAEENVAPGDAEPQLLDDGVFAVGHRSIISAERGAEAPPPLK
jgi:hypothetical protein